MLPSQQSLSEFPERDDRAKRRAAEPLKPAKPQAPCDVGLFGDQHLQSDLFDQ